VLEKRKSKYSAITGAACTIPFKVPFAFGKAKEKPMFDEMLLQAVAVLHAACKKVTTDMHCNCTQMGWQPFIGLTGYPGKNGKRSPSLMQPMPVWPSGATSTDPSHLLYS
jgi:hypothetical protein